MKAYKVLTENMTSPYDNETQWELGRITKIKKDEKLEIRKYGLYAYKSLNNVSSGKFGSRVFEAEIIGVFIEDNNVICAYEIKLIKEIEPKDVTDSEWAYNYCQFVKDNPEVRKNITNSEWAYYYCKNIKNNPEVRKNITNSKWAFSYCLFINDDTEVRKNITDSEWAYKYCKNINNDPKVRKFIIE